MEGKINITVQVAPTPVWEPSQSVFSIRKEANTSFVDFIHQYLLPASLTNNQVLYTEGIPGDPSQTYIKISSVGNQNVTASGGLVSLKIESNGISGQLDKTVNVSIGGNTLPITINFKSRPDTHDFGKAALYYAVPIEITKQDLLANISDEDSSLIVEVAIETNGDTNFSHAGLPYTGGWLTMAQIDAEPIVYTPDNNPNGYTKSYFYKAKDEDGLITIP